MESVGYPRIVYTDVNGLTDIREFPLLHPAFRCGNAYIAAS
jgi:hypothetical protein